jgi:hypothetical protein
LVKPHQSNSIYEYALANDGRRRSVPSKTFVRRTMLAALFATAVEAERLIIGRRLFILPVVRKSLN